MWGKSGTAEPETPDCSQGTFVYLRRVNVRIKIGRTAVLGVLAAIDTVSTSTGGIFANAALAVGVVLRVAVTSIVMVRTSS
jgi:hypothetical protein